MKTQPITKEQILSLRKTMAGAKRKIDWDKIDYDVGRGIISNTKYCLWTEEGYRIDISVRGRNIIISQSERKDDEYFKLKNQS